MHVWNERWIAWASDHHGPFGGLSSHPVSTPMTLADSNIDKGALAYAAIRAIEELLADFNHQLADNSDDALHDVIWDQLGHITVKPV